MKVLYLSEAVLPSQSANSIAIFNMCNGIALNGYEVELVAIQGENLDVDIYEYYSVKKSEYLKVHLINAGKQRKVRQALILLEGLKKMKWADIVYTRWDIAAIFAKIVRKNTIIEYHKMFTNDKQYKMASKIIKSHYTIKVVLITESLKVAFEKEFGPSDKYVVESGASQVSGNDSKSFVPACGYIGSFYKGKGIEIVLQTAKKMPHVRFHIVGGKKEEISNLKKEYEVGENVIWYGYQPYSETLKLTKKFGIALLPNQPSVVVGGADIGQYTSPNKMFEYMAEGKVIVASDIGVLKEVLCDGENALLAPHDDVGVWVEKIEQIINDTNIQKSISSRAKEAVREKYNWSARADRILSGLNNG